MVPQGNDKKSTWPPSVAAGKRRAQRWLAGIIAAGWLLTLFWIVLDAEAWVDYPAKSGQSDFDLYFAEIGRIAQGETYYQAALTELTSRGYPTTSAFNWRTPLPIWLLGKLPDPNIGKWILAASALGLAGWSGIQMLNQLGWTAAILGITSLAGIALTCSLGHFYAGPIFWASILIGLSLCAENSGYVRTSIVLGTLAAIFRELAVGYCLLAVCRAVVQGRRREAAGWLAGIACFAVWYLWHMNQVAAIVGGERVTDTTMWWHLKSPWFLVKCAQMNGFLIILPRWISYVYLSLALLGLVFGTQRANDLARWFVFGYLTVFLAVGHGLNDYWGILVAPALAMGFANTPSAFGLLRRELQS